VHVEHQDLRAAALIDMTDSAATSAIERIRADLDAGRLWKARDRVTGLFSADPTAQAVLTVAGEVYYRMGDLPRAAAFWMLTEHSGPEVETAMVAMRDRYPRVSDLAAALPIRDSIEAFPAGVQERLREVQKAVKEQSGYDWEPARRPRRQFDRPKQNRIVAVLNGALLVALLGGIWMVGVATLVFLMVRLIGSVYR
jgi:hypothetical protein